MAISLNSTTTNFTETVPVKADIGDKKMRIGFNIGFMLEALKNCEDDNIIIHYSGDLKPMVITQETKRTLHLIVPMKVKDDGAEK